MSGIDLFGEGISAPFQRDGKGDFAHKSGLDGLRSDIAQLLGIMGPGPQSPGELPWRTEMGSRLHTLKHRQLHNDLMTAMAQQYTGETIRRWEDRVRVGQTEVSVRDPGTNENTLDITTTYTPLGHRPVTGDKVTISFQE